MGTRVVDLGLVVGPKGDKGDKGDPGEIGPQGPKGDPGEPGSDGAAGAAGKSAYQYAVEGGYTGSVEDFKAQLANLVMADHKHDSSDITSGTLPVSRGGLGRSTLTSGYFLRGNGTGAVTQSTPTAARQAMSALTGVGPTTITLTADGWTGDGPWTQTVNVSGVTASDNHIHIYPVDTEDADARKLYEAAYGCLAPQAETGAGWIKFTCRDKKPEINFQAVVEGARA